MREIKFRGVQEFGTKKGRMLFGSIHFNQDESSIADGYVCTIHVSREMPIYVDPETVGQYTGLKDKNGNDIYEGDIVCDHNGRGVVKYSDKHGAFRVSYGDGQAKWFYDYILKGELESIEIMGNIHENPELLEKEK